MMLHKFLEQYEEAKAHRRVKDFFFIDTDGQAKVEFLNHYLTSVFQPILQVREKQIETVGFEAFVRPIAGALDISPLQFFTNLDSENQVFVDRLCRELHVNNFSQQANPDEFISLNISPTALEQDAAQFDDIKIQIQAAENLGLSPNRIYVELAISTELDPGVIYSISGQLREMGLNITLEDFDSDTASFSRILYTRPKVVKFNRSWLNADLCDGGYINLVSDIVDGITALGAKAHLEKIETKQEFQFAIATGFHFLQGFYFGQPNTRLKRHSEELVY